MNAYEGRQLKPGQQARVKPEVNSVFAGLAWEIRWVGDEGLTLTGEIKGTRYTLYFEWEELEKAE